jgi:hypothetical protein
VSSTKAHSTIMDIAAVLLKVIFKKNLIRFILIFIKSENNKSKEAIIGE